MSRFGWSYPAGCEGTPFDDEEPAENAPTFPAGMYYLGDLCYVVTPHGWSRMPSPPDQVSSWHGTVQGHPVWLGWTAHGDGVYVDQDARVYGVDSGTIGVLTVRACDPKQLEATAKAGLGQVHLFDTPFVPTCEEGCFTIGHIVIETRAEEEENADTAEETR